MPTIPDACFRLGLPRSIGQLIKQNFCLNGMTKWLVSRNASHCFTGASIVYVFLHEQEFHNDALSHFSIP